MNSEKANNAKSAKDAEMHTKQKQQRMQICVGSKMSQE